MYDLIIIGGSAAATAAGIYAARRNLNFKIITKEFGGEVATSGEIGNWPGDGMTDGLTLSDKFREHLILYSVDVQEGVLVDKIIKQEDGTFCISTKTDSGCNYVAKTVIVATGVHPKELNLPGEKEYRGKGVTYCTTCDGPLFSGKVTAVVGGGNSALEAGLMMAEIASKVYIVNKNAQFKGDQILIDKLSKHPKVEILYEVKTTAVIGEQFVKGLKYTDKEGKEQELAVEGIFVHIGMIPNSNVVSEDVIKNKFGEIEVNAKCETNISGLYAAGDVTNVPFNQIVIAAGQGCAAALAVVEYINRLRQ